MYRKERFYRAVRNAIENAENGVFSVPTGFGKSHFAATTHWREEYGLTALHLHTTKAARDYAAKLSKTAGLSVFVFRGSHDLCPMAQGKYDYLKIRGQKLSEFIKNECKGKGNSFQFVHRLIQKELPNCPCSEGCKYESQWTEFYEALENEEYDIIHATTRFVHVPELVTGNVIIFDEYPTYSFELDQDSLRQGVNPLLHEVSDGKYTIERLMEALRTDDRDTIADISDIVSPFVKNREKIGENGHRQSLDMLRALLKVEKVTETTRVGMSGNIRIALDELNNVTEVIQLPDLSEAHCVIGFDAHPAPLAWQIQTGLKLPIKKILTPEEERSWRVNTRRLRIVQVGESIRSYTGGWSSSQAKEDVEATIRTIHRKYDKEFFAVICPKSIKTDVHQIMESAGVENPEILHYGELKSRNDFSDARVGLVIGCISVSDKEVFRYLGYLGFTPVPEVTDGGGPGRGRVFIGRYADAAEELRESVRSDNVAQAVGRFSRRVHDTEDTDGATVYVLTSVLPEEVVDEKVPGVVRRVTKTQRKLEELVAESDGPVTGREVEEELEISRRHALELLDELSDAGITSKSEGTGKYGATEYIYTSGSLKPAVDLGFGV
jgi:biotin operon repressor